MNPIDVVMPTLGMQGNRTIESLKYLPKPYSQCLTSNAPGWSNAVNQCLKKRGPGHDVLIIDDDAELLPDTFKGYRDWYPKADIFGFKLLYSEPGPDKVMRDGRHVSGDLQHDGGWVTWDDNQGALAGHIFNDSDLLSTVSYVTASICLIKSHVIDQLGDLNVWPGAHWEDVAYCARAWAAGLQVAYVPNAGIHRETQTKKHDPRFMLKFRLNQLMLTLELEDEIKAVSRRFQFKKRRKL